MDSDQTIWRKNKSVELQCKDATEGDVDLKAVDDGSLVGDIAEAIYGDVAARPDDAEAEPSEWDEWTVKHFRSVSGVLPLVCVGTYDSETHGRLFDAFRRLLERRYRRNVLQSLLSFLREKFPMKGHGKRKRNAQDQPLEWIRLRGKVQPNKKPGKLWELQRDLEVGKDAVSRAANSTWWSWEAGSTLFYWRWPLKC